jgi:hypothetical protein
MTFDILLNDGTVDLGLMLYQDSSKKGQKSIRSTWAPASSGLTDHAYRDWKNGFGYSQPGIVNDGYSYGLNVDARSPGVVTAAGAITEVDLTGLANVGVISDSFSLGDHYYFLAGRTMVKVLNGYSTLSTVGDAGVGQHFITAAVAKYAGTSYAWIGGSNGFHRYDGTTLTSTTGFVRNRLKTVYWATTDGVAVQRLVATENDFTVRHVPLTSDPMTSGNWTAAITVGEGVYPCNALVSTGRHIYLSTSGGVYDLDDLGQTVNLSPYHIDSYSVYSGLACYYLDGSLLYSAHTGIDAIDISQPGIKQGIANWAMPGAAVGIPNETPIYGRVSAFTNDGGWVVAAVYNGTDSYLIYGKRRQRLGFPGPGEWVWHGAFAKFASQLVLNLVVRTVNQAGVISRRLWIATQANGTAATSRLFWQSLPLTTTPRQDKIVSSAHRFATSWSLYSTPADWQSPTRSKTVTKATFDARDLTTTTTLALAVATDEVTFGSTLGTVDDVADATLNLAGDDIEGKQITPLVTAAGTTTVPAVLRSLTLTGAVDPDADEVLEFDVWLSRENQLGHGGARSHSTPEVDYEDLALMQSQKVTLTLPDRTPVTAIIETALPGSMQEIESGPEGTRGWGRKVTVRAIVVERPALYGSARYGVARYT